MVQPTLEYANTIWGLEPKFPWCNQLTVRCIYTKQYVFLVDHFHGKMELCSLVLDYRISPYYLMDQRKVEAIHRRATKLITSLCESDYNTKLAELNFPSLNYRRQCSDMIYLYQIFNNVVDINVDELFTLSSSTTRGHEFKLYKHHSSCFPRSNFFSCRVVNAWNNFPPCIVESSSLNNFKANLDAYWTDNMYIFA